MSTDENTNKIPDPDELLDELNDIENEVRHGDMGHPISTDSRVEFETMEGSQFKGKVESSDKIKPGNLPAFDDGFYPKDSTPLPVPEKKIADDECQECGAKIPIGQNFCKDTDCELRYGFSGVSDGVFKRYLKVMENVKLFKERNARA